MIHLGLGSTLVSIISVAVPVGVTVLNFRIKFVERKEDKITKRPYLVVDSVKIVPAGSTGASLQDVIDLFRNVPDQNNTHNKKLAEIRVSIRNNGVRPASRVALNIDVRSAADPSQVPGAIHNLDTVNPLPSGTPVTMTKRWLQPKDIGKQWICITLNCDDALFGATCAPTKYFYEWPGVHEPEVLTDQLDWGDVTPLSATDLDCFTPSLADTPRLGLAQIKGLTAGIKY